MPHLANVAKAKEIEYSPFDGKYLSKDRQFSLEKCIDHTVRNAGYKALENRIHRVIEGNNANDRDHRTVYESSQQNTASILSESHRGSAHSQLQVCFALIGARLRAHCITAYALLQHINIRKERS